MRVPAVFVRGIFSRIVWWKKDQIDTFDDDVNGRSTSYCYLIADHAISSICKNSGQLLRLDSTSSHNTEWHDMRRFIKSLKNQQHNRTQLMQLTDTLTAPDSDTTVLKIYISRDWFARIFSITVILIIYLWWEKLILLIHVTDWQMLSSHRASLNYEERMFLANINRQVQLSKKKEFAVRDIRNVKGATSSSDGSDRTKQTDDVDEFDVAFWTKRTRLPNLFVQEFMSLSCTSQAYT